MSRGLSLHIGLNDVDPEHYSGWSSPLQYCEEDARAMHEMSVSLGFTATQITGAEVTRDRVIGAIEDAARRLVAGDLFFLTYAGHGGQVKDVDGDEQGGDGRDETWCLWDGQVLDDELNVLWARFQPRVRILVLADSCHSGSVTKGASGGEDENDPTARFLPRAAARATVRKNWQFYDNLQYDLPNPRPAINASVRLLAGCQDDQRAREQDGHGDFTRALLALWDEGRFEGNYRAFYLALAQRMSATQQPNHLVLGRPDPTYDEQSPFTI
ncbi:MAG: caspase family protein [Pseudomonadota bacterium]